MPKPAIQRRRMTHARQALNRPWFPPATPEPTLLEVALADLDARIRIQREAVLIKRRELAQAWDALDLLERERHAISSDEPGR